VFGRIGIVSAYAGITASEGHSYTWYVLLDDGDYQIISGSQSFYAEVASGNSLPIASSPSPADGSHDNPLTVTLEVDIVDSDGDNVEVSFYWDTPVGSDYLIDTDSVNGGAGTASVSWSGLNYYSTYSWYVLLDDGIDSGIPYGSWILITDEEVPSGSVDLFNVGQHESGDVLTDYDYGSFIYLDMFYEIPDAVAKQPEDRVWFKTFDGSVGTLLDYGFTDDNFYAGADDDYFEIEMRRSDAVFDGSTYYMYMKLYDSGADYYANTNPVYTSPVLNLICSDNAVPTFGNETPASGTVNVTSALPSLKIGVSDDDGNDGTEVRFYWYISANNVELIGTDVLVDDENTAVMPLTPSDWRGGSFAYNTSYIWYAIIDDGADEVYTGQFNFTTIVGDVSSDDFPSYFNVTPVSGATVDSTVIPITFGAVENGSSSLEVSIKRCSDDHTLRWFTVSNNTVWSGNVDIGSELCWYAVIEDDDGQQVSTGQYAYVLDDKDNGNNPLFGSVSSITFNQAYDYEIWQQAEIVIFVLGQVDCEAEFELIDVDNGNNVLDTFYYPLGVWTYRDYQFKASGNYSVRGTDYNHPIISHVWYHNFSVGIADSGAWHLKFDRVDYRPNGNTKLWVDVKAPEGELYWLNITYPNGYVENHGGYGEGAGEYIIHITKPVYEEGTYRWRLYNDNWNAMSNLTYFFVHDRDDSSSSDDDDDGTFLGYSMQIWLIIFGICVVLFMFLLPSLALPHVSVHPMVNMFSGFVGYIGCAMFGVFPLWLTFIIALLVIVYIVNMMRN